MPPERWKFGTVVKGERNQKITAMVIEDRYIDGSGTPRFRAMILSDKRPIPTPTRRGDILIFSRPRYREVP